MLRTNDLFKLEGKVALITGGASGIGFATAKRLAEFGANVMLLDINEELGETAARHIQDLGGAARFFKCNVVSQEDCRQVTEAIEEAYGRIDILFNNAGVIRRKTVVELEEQDWDLVINVSLKGAYNLSKYVIPIMAKSGGGSIINTGSGWGIKGGDKAAAYCAAKAGVVNLTRAMAIDHGPENIRVNCVSPGDTDTPLLREEARQLNKEESAFLVSSAQGRPLERLGTPQDIANAVLFFASDLSAWVTGSVLVVDGGGLA
ncbi:3-oxoacyl-[acyl-carrier-protein] reductase FabG [Brevibacillus reuszeri]|uniref:SDR family NAD(P)-dependent oxidoreductase n=1 Tax=Brevibacillus reuszeri TaxID=54915 RepID=UPI001B19037F|nr:SDR family NAD(P)-dependent oxidoreductase [Brevibacillus reuszeri]GIO07728.1 3-oxoacyl-[acyl-carrier-protein] reductase FabG [Brevibacillus reuszeri]